MAIPVGAIFSGVARATAGGARAAAGAAMGGAKEAARGAVRGAVKRAVGGGKKMKSPVSGMITAVKGAPQTQTGGGGGGAIVPIGSSIVPTPRSESSIVPVSGASTSILDQLRSINSTLQQILEVERKEKDKLEDTILDFVRRDEKQKREEEQEKQERKKGKGRKKESPMVKAAKKAVSGIWDFIMGLVGDFIKYKILDWLGDPKNRKNVQRIVEFIQGLVGFLNGLWKHVIAPLGGFVFTQLFNTLKLFGAILTPIIDLFTFKWLTNPKEFIDGIINIPKTLIGAFKDSADSLINLLTFGLFDNIGGLVDSIIKNFNPFNLFGGGEDKEEKVPAPTEVPKQEQSQEQEAPAKDVPKLEKGGIVGKQEESANPTVQPLSKLVEEAKLSSMITEGIMPFMDMMTAPFKIIGTAVVGLMLKTLSKIPFVGELIEPIIKMSASAFGIPPEVLTQLQVGTKKDNLGESRKLDEEEVAKEMMSGIKDIQEMKEDESFGSQLSAGFKSLVGGVGNVLGAIFTPPANAREFNPGGGGGGGFTQPSYEDFDASKTYKTGDIARKDGQLKEFDGMGWGAVKSPGPSLASAAGSLKGMSSASGPDGGRNGCVWAVNKVYEKAGITPPWGSSLYVPTAESKMINAGYQQVSYDQRQPGDVMVMYDQKSPPQAHIGVVLENGNVLSNSSSRAAFSWEATPEAYNREYGGTGKIYRMPGTGNATMIAQKSRPSQGQIQTGVSKTGSVLGQVQQESFALDKQPAKSQIAMVNGGMSSTSFLDETATQPTLGLTLPSSGLWATYRTNL